LVLTVFLSALLDSYITPWLGSSKLCRIPGYRRYQLSRAMKNLWDASAMQITRTLEITHHVHEAWRHV